MLSLSHLTNIPPPILITNRKRGILVKNIINEHDVNSMIAFTAAVSDACKEADKAYTFTCPLCDGEGYAIKLSQTGRSTGFCKSCGVRVVDNSEY